MLVFRGGRSNFRRKTLPTHSPYVWPHFGVTSREKNITHYNREWLEEGNFPPPHFPQFRTLRIKEKTNICPGGDKGISKMMRKGTKTSKSWSSMVIPKNREVDDKKQTWWSLLVAQKIRLGLICFCWASGWYDWYTMFWCWIVRKESWKKKTKKNIRGLW